MLLGEEKKVTSYFFQLYPCLSIKQLDHMYVVSLRDTLGAGSFSRCPIDKDRLYRILTGSQKSFWKEGGVGGCKRNVKWPLKVNKFKLLLC